MHNTQPWLWRIGPGTVELHADWTRHLPATDPDRRDVLLSCGAALHHLQVALAARGTAAQVNRLPDPEDLAHELRHQVLHIPEYPQLIIRIGWPATAAAELPPTPRRDLRSVLLPCR